MPTAPDSASAIAEIKKRVSIADLIQRTVSLKKIRNNYVGLCPFHNEKSPSFYVYSDNGGSYHCFGCKASGDIFNFIMETQGLAFGDTLKQLAQQAGVELPERGREGVLDQGKERLRGLLTSAETYFHNLLLNDAQAQPARDYLLKRGVTAAGVTTFNLGYALDSWDALHSYLKERSYSAEEMRDAGVLRERDGGGFYDYFRNRLIFPIRDGRGQTVGFGGRALKDEDRPKYLNSPQTALFDKGSILYGIDLARASIKQQNQAVIVEGYLDALIAQQHGQSNVVATLGTAMTEKHIASLKKLTRNVVLALDADAAGDMAALKDAEQLRQGMDHLAIPVYNARGLVGYEHKLDASIRIAVLPAGEDPDQVIRRSTSEWQATVAAALPVVDHYINVVAGKHDLDSPLGRKDAVYEVAPLIVSVGDAVEREGYLEQLARRVHAPLDSVRRSIQDVARKQRQSQRLTYAPNPAPDYAEQPAPEQPQPVERLSPLQRLEQALLSLLLRYPQAVHSEGAPGFGDFSSTPLRLIYAALLEQDAASLLADRKASQSAYQNLTAQPTTSGGIDSNDTIENDGPFLPYPQLCAGLDSNLHDEVAHLWREGSRGPELFGPEVERNLRRLQQRLHEDRDRLWLKRQSQMIAEAQDAGDEEAISGLLDDVSNRLPVFRSYAPPPSTVIRDSRDGRPPG